MSYSVAELASWVGGTVHGDGSRQIIGVAPILDATPDQITFAVGEKNKEKLTTSNAGAVVLDQNAAPLAVPTIHVDDPEAAILSIAARLKSPIGRPAAGISPMACVDATAVLGPGCHVGPLAVIEAGVIVGPNCVIHSHAVLRINCRLGTEVEIHPHVVLYPETVIGNRSIVHGGAVIGSDGFGYRRGPHGHVKVPQLGHVEIGADVEIGANSTIDRGMIGPTRIGDGTKIDNQVQIAHNCRIGKRNIFAGKAALAGSCVTGDDVTLAGRASASDHVTIGNGAIIAAFSGAWLDIPPGQVQMGIPARPERDAKRMYLEAERVPELRKQLAMVMKHLGLDASRPNHEIGEASRLRKKIA